MLNQLSDELDFLSVESNLYLPIFILLVWLCLIPVSLLRRAARGDSRPIPIFPTIPVIPLCAWGLAANLNRYGAFQLWFVGALHTLILILFLISATMSLATICKNRKNLRKSAPICG